MVWHEVPLVGNSAYRFEQQITDLEPFLAQYPGLKYSYLIEIKYIKPRDKKKTIPREEMEKIKEEAENQLDRYSRDEKFQKTIGHTTLKKLVLIFRGNRMVYHGEI